MIRHPFPLFAIGLLALGAAPVHAQKAPADSATLFQQGKQLFLGRALCFACHGLKGEGLLGPDSKLAGRKLIYTKADLTSLMSFIKSGVDSTQSQSKLMMPPMGGARLTDAEVKAVATYVLDLLRQDPSQ